MEFGERCKRLDEGDEKIDEKLGIGRRREGIYNFLLVKWLVLVFQLTTITFFTELIVKECGEN